MCLATMAYISLHSMCSTSHVTVFSTGSNIRPVCNFMELHTLTQATHSYALSIGFIIAKSFTIANTDWKQND